MSLSTRIAAGQRINVSEHVAMHMALIAHCKVVWAREQKELVAASAPEIMTGDATSDGDNFVETSDSNSDPDIDFSLTE